MFRYIFIAFFMFFVSYTSFLKVLCSLLYDDPDENYKLKHIGLIKLFSTLQVLLEFCPPQVVISFI